MDLQFKKHYTRNEARQLLPDIRAWLAKIVQFRESLRDFDDRFAHKLAAGCDLGGEPIHRWVSNLAELQGLLMEFSRREIILKDLSRGLVDFPAMLDGREVFLCWKSGEEDIAFWHDLDAGYAGREPMDWALSWGGITGSRQTKGHARARPFLEI